MKRVIKRLFVFLLILTLFAGVIFSPILYRGYVLYREVVRDTPVAVKVEEIRDRENYVKLEDISDYFVKEIIQSEDKRFRLHFGVDPLAVLRAVKNDLLAGSLKEGGSTITQQLAKNMYFDFEKSFERKVAEALVAFQLEREYTKDEILEMYLNCIYFGENCYGVKEAAAYYYSTTPTALSQEQADSLVYTIKCPNLYNPRALQEQ